PGERGCPPREMLGEESAPCTAADLDTIGSDRRVWIGLCGPLEPDDRSDELELERDVIRTLGHRARRIEPEREVEAAQIGERLRTLKRLLRGDVLHLVRRRGTGDEKPEGVLVDLLERFGRLGEPREDRRWIELRERTFAAGELLGACLA